MLQLTNCYLERIKVWKACNSFREGITLDNGQWEEGVLIIACRCMQLAKGHRMAVPRNSI